MSRIEKLQALLNEKSAFIIVDSKNRRYFTGMETSNGVLVVTKELSVFMTDFRYITAAKTNIKKPTDVVLLSGSHSESVKKFFEEKRLDIKTVYFESGRLSYLQAKAYIDAMPEKEFLNGDSAISSLRQTKDEKEIQYVIEAQKITDKSFLYIQDFIASNWKKGITEKQIAFELEFDMRRNGSGEMPFSIIVASGANGALPHAVPSDKVIEAGDFITIDYGSSFNGYVSDMTRTVAVGHVSEEQEKVYNIVLEAQMKAIAGIKAGITGKEADSIAREVITEAGYGEYFGHSLGHGVGVEVHEAPNFSQMFEKNICENSIMSVEPGIYMEGKFGVRIEDLVVVKNDGVIDITASDKKLIIL
ncbi:MAG: aminopeptidase P family protein [Clostridia bacterium]|nr:aminopeptidase P family protein [Clostridia bacterium]